MKPLFNDRFKQQIENRTTAQDLYFKVVLPLLSNKED